MEADQISKWISERRFAPFMERAAGERAIAVDLYLWQTRVDQNLGRPLSEMIDVANTIDPACGKWLATHTEMTALLEQRPAAG